MANAKIIPEPTKITQNIRRSWLLAQKYDLVVAYEGMVWGIHINT
jgi:hypothetical protein